MKENKSYVTLPERKYMNLLKKNEELLKTQDSLIEIMKTDDRYLVFTNHKEVSDIVQDVWEGSFNHSRVKCEKVEHFIKELEDSLHDVKKFHSELEEKYSKVPNWVVNLFNKKK